jgi:hypothetical protein
MDVDGKVTKLNPSRFLIEMCIQITLRHDLRYGARMMFEKRAFGLIAIISLARRYGRPSPGRNDDKESGSDSNPGD